MLIGLRCLLSNPRSRPATAKLATRRFTSHSNGPGSVSSKSLTPKTRRRSGDANAAEVGKMGVAAELDVEARPGLAGEIRRHRIGRPTEERERGDQHPPVPDGYQFRHPRRRLLFEQFHRVASIRCRFPHTMHRAGHFGPRGLCRSPPARSAWGAVPACGARRAPLAPSPGEAPATRSGLSVTGSTLAMSSLPSCARRCRSRVRAGSLGASKRAGLARHRPDGMNGSHGRTGIPQESPKRGDAPRTPVINAGGAATARRWPPPMKGLHGDRTCPADVPGFNHHDFHGEPERLRESDPLRALDALAAYKG